MGGRKDSKKYPEKIFGRTERFQNILKRCWADGEIPNILKRYWADGEIPNILTRVWGEVDSRKRNWDLYKKIRDRIPPIIIPPIMIPPMIVAVPAVKEMFNKLEYNPIVNNQ